MQLAPTPMSSTLTSCRLAPCRHSPPADPPPGAAVIDPARNGRTEVARRKIPALHAVVQRKQRLV